VSNLVSKTILGMALAAGLVAGPLLPRAASASQGPDPRTCKVGAYVNALYDIDLSNGSFGADLWFWSTCPSPDLHPLDVMDFVNAKDVHTSLAATYDRAGAFWSYVKVSGLFRDQWNVQNYPFDRQTLRIVVENTDAPASSFTYVADREGSKVSSDIQLEGWRITNFDIREQTHVYDTVFGDPAFAGEKESDYARLMISISVARTRLLSFVKLVAGVYIAMALSILTFLLGPQNGRRRTSVHVGTLFAVLVNQRVAESLIGRTESMTLLDKIHVIAMIYIFLIALAGIYAEALVDRGLLKTAVRNEKWGLWLSLVSYVVVNAVLVWTAAARG
jgi:hypothetical protein